MTPTPVRDYDGLIGALRGRADNCGLATSFLDEMTGLPTGYTGKLFGPARVKMIGMDSLWLLLEALALKITIEPDPEALARMEHRWERREEIRRRPGIVRRRFSPEVRGKIWAEEMQRVTSMGGVARAACLPSKQASAIARKAAKARWKKTPKTQRKAVASEMAKARWSRVKNDQQATERNTT